MDDRQVQNEVLTYVGRYLGRYVGTDDVLWLRGACLHNDRLLAMDASFLM